MIPTSTSTSSSSSLSRSKSATTLSSRQTVILAGQSISPIGSGTTNHRQWLALAIASICCHSIFTSLVIPHCLCYFLGAHIRGNDEHRLRRCDGGGTDRPSIVDNSTLPRRVTSPSSPVRIALGIMSHPEDIEFREALRNTYLAEDPRICPLSLFNNKNGDETPEMRLCQIAYSFVILGKPFRTGGRKALKLETDVVFFRSENFWMSPSISQWFRHASQYRDVDYIAKVDIQTLLVPSTFLTMINERLDNPYLRHVFAGQPIDRLTCGGLTEPECRSMVGQTAMSPDLYFISKDLAANIPPSMYGCYSDAQCVSNWLYGMKSSPVLQLTLNPTKHGLWEKGPDDPTKFQKRWNELKQYGFRKELLKDFTPEPRWGTLEHMYSML